MHIVSKIKLIYYTKLIQDCLLNKKFKEVSELLDEIKIKNPKLLYQILQTIDQQLINYVNIELYKKKIIWVPSFDSEETKLVNSFLKFYLKSESSHSFEIGNYSEKVIEVIQNLKIDQVGMDITFDKIINLSNIFQTLVLLNSKSDYLILNTNSAFFESQIGTYMIYPNSTKCYLYIVANPKNLFLKYKETYNSKEEAIRLLLPGQNAFLRTDIKEFKFYENRQSWEINFKSWTNHNVMNTFKGKIFKFEDLLTDTENKLLEIIYHLKQSGIQLTINFDLIKKFVEDTSLANIPTSSLSNNEKKFFERNISADVLDEIGYTI